MSSRNVFQRELLFKLLLVRHGETEANRMGMFQGRIDWPLNDNGRGQISQTAEKLADYVVDHVYVSPAQRAQQTAEILNQKWDAPLTLDERLWEIDHGTWEGKSFQEVRDADPEAWRAWLALEIDAPHGGETLQETSNRLQQWYGEVKKRYVGQEPTLAVVAHGGCLQLLLADLLRTPHSNLWPYQFHNGAVAEVWVFALGAKLTRLGI